MLATKTLKAIDAAIDADKGARFRHLLRECVAACEDAYRADDEVRGHLGASGIGRPCDRELWYGFRWAYTSEVDSRVRRLWNRGHLEEGRFVALLMMIGVQVYAHDQQGNQFRISDVGGHFGSAIDGVLVGLPEMPTTPVLGEFKTHNLKSFESLLQKGMKESKPEHFAQVQVYMRKYDLSWCLYLAVCKDDDRLYGEYIAQEAQAGDHYLARAHYVIGMNEAPPRISNTASWWQCRFCNAKGLCHGKAQARVNCRTCRHSRALTDQRWGCELHQRLLSKTDQLAGCGQHDMIGSLRK